MRLSAATSPVLVIVLPEIPIQHRVAFVQRLDALLDVSVLVHHGENLGEPELLDEIVDDVVAHLLGYVVSAGYGLLVLAPPSPEQKSGRGAASH